MTVITEPTPLVASNRLYHAGRGGAGNYHRLPSTLPAPPTTVETTHIAPPPSNNYFGGRGGAGNVHTAGERAIFSFDEELERDRLFHEHHAPVYSVGRGGAGNFVPSDNISTRSHYSASESGSPRSSSSTERSSLRAGADKVLRGLARVRSGASQ
ncbi:hypothetical protein EDC01DRAFT_777761 [Geopyxis carbonaria]|nr:hypothetical protein EDC01DRAFT_777761 [Geopyxis carbonaria]